MNTKQGKPRRLFVDMDGTLAVFRQVDTLEKLYEPGYFLNLPPQQTVVDAVKHVIARNPDIEVHILSSVLTDSDYALTEKNWWLDEHLPEVATENRHFPPCGEDKKNYIAGEIGPSDALFDDYTANLSSWDPPGLGVKLLNGINHTNGTWAGSRLSIENEPEILAQNIVDIMNGETIYNDRPQEAAPLRTRKDYKYYSINRPVGIGTYPRTEPVLNIENYSGKELVEDGAFRAWGHIVYADPISEKDAAAYELRASPGNPDMQGNTVQETSSDMNRMNGRFDFEM